METGKLAQQQGFDLELQILKSQKGYYIGTATSEGYPVSRESAEYFPDSSAAQQALTDYINVINSEADKRTAQDDPLLAAVEKFKNKKRGKQHV